MSRILGWCIAFVAVMATVAGLLYLTQGTDATLAIGVGGYVAVPAATLWAGLDWAMSAEPGWRRFARLVGVTFCFGVFAVVAISGTLLTTGAA